MRRFVSACIWYRFDGDDSAAVNDGRHTDYLFAPSRHERFLRQCDPDLFERMLHLVKNDRSIAAVEANGVLPADTVFFSEGLSFKGTSFGERSVKRQKWLNAGLRRVEDAEIVFFDPDNGLEVPSRSCRSLMGSKYVYYDDLQSCWERGQSLVVYHHVGRTYEGTQGGRRRSDKMPEPRAVPETLWSRAHSAPLPAPLTACLFRFAPP